MLQLMQRGRWLFKLCCLVLLWSLGGREGANYTCLLAWWQAATWIQWLNQLLCGAQGVLEL